MLAGMSLVTLALSAHAASTPAPPFNANFYIVAATIIPVLFLALVVQTPAYLDLLRAAASIVGEDPGRAEPPLVVPRLLTTAAWVIVISGFYGEYTAVFALYQEHSGRHDNLYVFIATIILLTAVVLAPINAYMRITERLWPILDIPGTQQKRVRPGAGQARISRPASHLRNPAPPVMPKWAKQTERSKTGRNTRGR
jgi:hypothetical protein